MRATSLPLLVSCGCGHTGRLAVTGENGGPPPTWTCADCASVWSVSASGRAELAEVARGLARLRLLVVLIPTAAAVLVGALALVRPAWLLLLPLVLGGALSVYRPRYQRRLRELYAALPGLSEITCGAVPAESDTGGPGVLASAPRLPR